MSYKSDSPEAMEAFRAAMAEPEVEETTPAEPEAEPVVEDTPPAEPVVENEPVEPVETDGKTEPPVEDWEKRYKDQQSYIDRREAEIAKREQALAAAQAEAAQRQHVQAPPVQGIAPEQVNALIESAAHNPQQAFQLALEHAPEALPSVITKIRYEHGDELADQAYAAYAQILADHRAEQMRDEILQQVQPVQDQYHRQAVEQSAQSVVSEFLESKDRAELDMIMDDLTERITHLQSEAALEAEQRGFPVTETEARRLLDLAYYQARSQNEAKIAAGKAAAAKADADAKAAAVAEGGKPGNAPAVGDHAEYEKSVQDAILAKFRGQNPVGF